ncbi:MAG: outer membrane beta-barrel protein [Gemmatimonadales bacterium]|nr:outer membrane beta-barrel protein [Candidatus Palauibacter denitrificans]
MFPRVSTTGLLGCLVLAAFGAPAGLAAQADESNAGNGGFYLGLAFPLGQMSATMRKSVDNTAPNTLVPEPRRGQVFEDEASGDALSYGVGLVAGYRKSFSGGAYFLDAAAELETHGGDVEAQFAGVGVSTERKQLGESWPDRWNLDPETSYGVTLRLGGSPGGLQSRGISLYVLGGIRFAGAQFTNHYDGCFATEPCDPSEFQSGQEDRDMDFTVWKSGIGLEKTLSERIALRVEASYSVYAREEWTTEFEDVVVTVRSSMKASEAGLTAGLLLRP